MMADDSDEIDCQFTDDLICPYCGHTHQDDGEMNEAGDMQCDKCEKKFMFDVDYSKSYTSRKVPCMNGEPHAWKHENCSIYPNLKRCKVCFCRDYGEKTRD